MTTATRRPGLSMTEVLVALFLMGVGMLAVLTLFPLGAMNMAQALKDDRSTQAADMAEGYARWYWRERIEGGGAAEPFFQHMNNPVGPGYFTNPANNSRLQSPQPNTPGWPVAIDPMGVVARTGLPQAFLGDAGETLLRRDTLNLVNEQVAVQRAPFALRACTLIDGMGYTATGVPDTSSGVIDRDLRYNWLWVVQSRSADTPRVAYQKIVVFDKRSHLFAPAGSEVVYTPTQADVPNAITPVAGTFMRFNAGSNFQKGSWIMDVTTTVRAVNTVTGVDLGRFVPPNGPSTPPPPVGVDPIQILPEVRNAHFYKVVSVTEDGADVLVELNKPLEPDTGLSPAAVPIDMLDRRVVLLPGVAHVFEPSRPLGVAE